MLKEFSSIISNHIVSTHILVIGIFICFIIVNYSLGAPAVAPNYSWIMLFTLLLLFSIIVIGFGVKGRDEFGERQFRADSKVLGYLSLLSTFAGITILSPISLRIVSNFSFILQPNNINAQLRDYLYNVRSVEFSGLIEYGYLVALGVLLCFVLSGNKGVLIILPFSSVYIIIGSFESSTLSRFYSPALAYCLLAIVAHLLIKRDYRNNIAIFFSLTLMIFISFPVIFRATMIPGHSVFLSSDSAAMNKIIELRLQDVPMPLGVSLKSSFTRSQIEALWRSSNPNKIPAKFEFRSKEMIDLGCSLTVGPLLENYACSNSVREWSKDFAENFLPGIGAPVIPTSVYLKYAGYLGFAGFILNIFLLLMPLAVVSAVPWGRRTLFQPFIASAPLLLMKFVSLLRGDPFHAGVSYIWTFLVLSVVWMILNNSSRLVKAKR